MTKKLYLSQLEKKYRIVYLHNPKHFFLNTLYMEKLPNGNKLLCAYPRPHSKQFHRLALLKPLNRPKLVATKFTSIKTIKPFYGILQD